VELIRAMFSLQSVALRRAPVSVKKIFFIHVKNCTWENEDMTAVILNP